MGNVGFSDQAVSVKQKDVTQKPLSAEDIQKVDAYWRAANYLSVGQIYLKDNPLLERPLSPEDIKPRLLGHWGTTPGLNFIYVHLNRLILKHDLDMMYIIGPGHGGPGIVANTYLEGSYTEIYPHVEQNRDGMKQLFRPTASPATWPLRSPAPFMKAASWGTRCCMRTELRWIILSLLWRAWSAMVRPRPELVPQAGIPTNF